MRILTIHNRYLQRGGEDQSFDARRKLLQERGHAVDVLIEDNSRVAALGGIRTAQRTIWAADAYATVRQRLRETQYDLVDVHNTFPLLSPSIYYAARAQGVPVVQTLHNYRLVCPKATLFRDGRVCEDCLAKSVAWPAALHGCYRGSRLGSTAIVAMLATHRLLRTWRQTVNAYIAVSEFARQKFVSGGLPAARIAVARNFVHPDPGEGLHDGGYALFVGRLAPEKGIRTLLRAWESLHGIVPLRIVGDGPMGAEVAAAAQRLPGLQWLGSRPPAEVQRLMGEAALLVFPSEWYETFGLVAIEAYARGTPVVASRIGAVAEVVQDGETGVLVPPGRADALIDAIGGLWTDGRARLAAMGRRARRAYQTRYTAACAYDDLMRAYQLVGTA